MLRGLEDLKWFHESQHGRIFHGDSYHLLSNLPKLSVDLIVTSPPFGLVREKEYGNVRADKYLDWFRPFASEMHRVLKKTGSLVIDIGGSWNKGEPTRHLYDFKLLVMLCEDFGFYLAQDFYWWNPAKLPTPAEWVTVRRIRAKDAVNKVWWLSKSPWPKADNRRVLQPYSSSMQNLFERGYNRGKRPSGHDIGDGFASNNGAAIPPNLLAIANTESNTGYLRYCRDKGLAPHPARFPKELPEFFIRMLTDKGDVVVDPFAGSCVTGEVCERLERRWICIELRDDYLRGALGRFDSNYVDQGASRELAEYRLPRPGANWPLTTEDRIDGNGGRTYHMNKGRKRDRGG